MRRCSFPALNTISNISSRVQPIQNFFQNAKRGELASISYLEPSWGGAILNQAIHVDGTDFHPPVDVTHSEQFVRTVYEALTYNRAAWAKTLLVILFDEHGGTYDHVPPPWGAAPPWGTGTPPNPPQFNFAFTRFGVRVPALFLSPQIAAGTVVRSGTATPFDHTSLIASILDWKGISRTQAGLGQRVINAPNFWSVLNQSPARTDDNAFAPLPPAANGSPISFGQPFYLQHQASGLYVTTKQWYTGIPGYSGWYPTAGTEGGRVVLEFRANTIPASNIRTGPLTFGPSYQIRSDESNTSTGQPNQPEWYNTLFANKTGSSYACWYGAANVTQSWSQSGWIAHLVSGAAENVQYNTPIRLESLYYPGYYLTVSKGSIYLTQNADSSSVWEILPAPGGG